MQARRNSLIKLYWKLLLSVLFLAAGLIRIPGQEIKRVQIVKLDPSNKYSGYSEITEDLRSTLVQKFSIDPDNTDLMPDYQTWEIMSEEEKVEDLADHNAKFLIVPRLALVGQKLRITVLLMDDSLQIVFNEKKDITQSSNDFEEYKEWIERLLEDYLHWVHYEKLKEEFIIVKLSCNGIPERLSDFFDNSDIEDFSESIPLELQDYFNRTDNDLNNSFRFIFYEEKDPSYTYYIDGKFEFRSEDVLLLKFKGKIKAQRIRLTDKEIDITSEQWVELLGNDLLLYLGEKLN